MMFFQEVFDQFAQKSPTTVMFRAILEHAFSDQKIDRIFREHAVHQWENELLFSTVVDLLALAVTGKKRSINAAYNHRKENIPVSVKSVYNKLNGTEPGIARALVREPAASLVELLRKIDPDQPGPNAPLLKGYRTKILDGKHLGGTEHRLKETRSMQAAPLPGQLLVVLDPQLSLAIDLFPCEDAYSQERSLLPEVYETVEANDLWIADRNFCTTESLFTIAGKNAFFLIRQHGSTLHGKTLQGERTLVGQCETGVVYEQMMEIENPHAEKGEAEKMQVRRITVELDKPTRHGEKTIHVLTNLPAEEDAIQLAMLYLERWQIENLFGEISQSFEGEIKTLCHPPAALLAFCLALMTYNLQSLLKSVMQVEFAEAGNFANLSTYYLSGTIEADYSGMMVILEPWFWSDRFSEQTAEEMAEFLLRTVGQVRIDRYQKTTRGERKEPPKRTSQNGERHVSTARILKARQKAKIKDD